MVIVNKLEFGIQDCINKLPICAKFQLSSLNILQTNQITKICRVRFLKKLLIIFFRYIKLVFTVSKKETFK